MPLLAMVGCDSGSMTTYPGGDADGGPSSDGTSTWADGSAGDQGPPSCSANETLCGQSCCNNQGQICMAQACVQLGPPCSELEPCPLGFACDKSLARCLPGASRCEYRPPVGVFTPKVEWEWTQSPVLPGYNQVMMTPMVANLTDDNGDGKVDRQDIPDIVFHTYTGSNYRSDGVMRVISGDGSGEHFTITDAAHRTHPGTHIALGDIDGDGISEIVACASGGGTIAFENDGTFKWRNKQSCYAPALADLDGDGKVEIVLRGSVVEGATGTLIWKGSKGCGAYGVAADLDGDGKMEVICGNVVYKHDGTLVWAKEKILAGSVALADLDGDGDPEIITTLSGEHALYAHHHDGTLMFGPIDINQGKANLGDDCKGCGGGPPTIADFDGDGKPEIAAAGGYGYVIFEDDGSPKWFKTTQDLSSRATGSSVFDFEGDGKAEVVYGDELVLRIYGGASGDVLFSHCNTSGTLQEYPVIVDVDNDNHAEIVVANNNYAFKTCGDGSASKTGIRVLGDTKNNWVRTRRIWNQHTYHVTNIDEDGKVPQKEAQNWKNPHLNNFRQNVQPGGLFDAPDLQVARVADGVCSTSIKISAVVKNQGAAKVVAGVNVSLYYRDPVAGDVKLQTRKTKTTVFPSGQEVVQFDVPVTGALLNKKLELFVVVDDDGLGVGAINECLEQNNKVDLGQVTCKGVG
jgi:hypothetical protein